MKLPDRFYINITQEDIEWGAINDCNNCPTARAIKRKFPGSMPLVGTQSSTIHGVECAHSKPLQKFITNFDGQYDVSKPGKFLLTRDPYATRRPISII